MQQREQGLTYCRPEKKNTGRLPKTSDKYCKVCKFRIRGKNHNEGQHHKQAENK